MVGAGFWLMHLRGGGTALYGIAGESRMCGRDRDCCFHGGPAGKAHLLGWQGANSVFDVEKGLAGAAKEASWVVRMAGGGSGPRWFAGM